MLFIDVAAITPLTRLSGITNISIELQGRGCVVG